MKTVWNRLVPIKIRICFWRARIDRLPTKNNLIKRGLNNIDDVCALCTEENETSDHVFVSCRMAGEVRRAINSWRKLLPVNCTKSERLLREMVGQAYIWAVWNGRNNAIFRNQVFNPLTTANKVQAAVYLWCKSRGSRVGGLDWVNWCCSPSL